MPIIEFFVADAIGAGAGEALVGDAIAGDALASTVGSDILGGSALADAYGMGAGANMGGAGITQANMASNALTGGAGAGSAGINAAQVAAQQGAASAIPGSGITQAAAPNFDQYANAATNTLSDAGSGMRAPVGNAFTPEQIQEQQDFMKQFAQDVRTAPSTPEYGNVVDNGGMNAPQPNALERGWDMATKFVKDNPFQSAFGAYTVANKLGLLNPSQAKFNADPYNGPLSKYRLSPDFKGSTANPQDYQYTPHYAAGGILSAAAGGPVEQMSNNAAIGANTMYPMASMNTSAFATPYQDPKSSNMLSPTIGGAVDQMTGELKPQGTRFAEGGVTGSGGINLNIPLDINGGGGGGGNAFSSPGTAYSQMGQGEGQFQSVFNGQNNSGLQGVMQALGQMTQGQGQQNNQMQMFAQGGIASYKSGGNLSDTMNYYSDMMEGPAKQQIARMQTPAPAAAFTHDSGIIRDTDPDTMYLDPVSAAQVRMAKINKRANMQTPGMKRPTPMGAINLKPQGTKAEAGGSSLDPENAAQGGIMQAGGHLGGYAAGGQPRLLKGPGDGMSDDIPATIANKQPARLADGEFVVPADVVSHLGNGSTDAGAKKLHGMMDNVRKARTGRKAQGKQINPNRFMPK